MQFRPYPILSIFTIAILAVLIALGNWQFSRYEFKSALENAPPPAFEELKMAKVAVREFQQYHLSGQPIDKYIGVETSQDGKYGKRIFTILNCEIGKVFYEIGFIADFTPAHDKIIRNQLSKPIKADVVARAQIRPNKYIPDNKPNENRIFWPEISAMEQVLGQSADFKDFYFTPILQDPLQTGKPSRNPFADPKGASYVEPARHLGYAITWWGLAIGLVGVYIALHAKNGRLNLNSK